MENGNFGKGWIKIRQRKKYMFLVDRAQKVEYQFCIIPPHTLALSKCDLFLIINVRERPRVWDIEDSWERGESMTLTWDGLPCCIRLGPNIYMAKDRRWHRPVTDASLKPSRLSCAAQQAWLIGEEINRRVRYLQRFLNFTCPSCVVPPNVGV